MTIVVSRVRLLPEMTIRCESEVSLSVVRRSASMASRRPVIMPCAIAESGGGRASRRLRLSLERASAASCCHQGRPRSPRTSILPGVARPAAATRRCASQTR